MKIPPLLWAVGLALRLPHRPRTISSWSAGISLATCTCCLLNFGVRLQKSLPPSSPQPPGDFSDAVGLHLVSAPAS